jgi:hypothetical protein
MVLLVRKTDFYLSTSMKGLTSVMNIPIIPYRVNSPDEPRKSSNKVAENSMAVEVLCTFEVSHKQTELAAVNFFHC